jgi:diadenosine tetraphosphate (Ap4A) HIT family hydrolase
VLRFNVGINSGAVAGQTVMYTHIHLIARRERRQPVSAWRCAGSNSWKSRLLTVALGDGRVTDLPT